MKLTSLIGDGTGRLGGSVFAVRRGEQIVRKYQPVVSNPSTGAQVAQRAKFKLAQQVAAVLGDDVNPWGIVDRQKSARNSFTSNLLKSGAITYANATASVALADLKLTGSSLYGGANAGASFSGSRVTVNFVADPLFSVPGSILVGVVVRPLANYGLAVIGRSSTVISAGQTSLNITTALTAAATDRVLFYAVRPASQEAIVAYGNIEGMDANAILEVMTKLAAVGNVVYSITYNVNPTAQSAKDGDEMEQVPAKKSK